MKLKKIIFLFFLLSTHNVSYCWRIENNILIIEKGDNLSDISHSLLGKGIKYDVLWRKCVDNSMSRNPNLIYDGMEFSLDSLLPYDKPTDKKIIIYNAIKEPENSKWSSKDWVTFIFSFLTLFTTIAVVFIGNRLITNNEKNKQSNLDKQEKIKIAFDLLSEFNSSEMHLHRVLADNVIAKNILLKTKIEKGELLSEDESKIYFRNFEELGNKNIENKRSIFMVINFYKKIQLLKEANKIDLALTSILFGEIFFYWWKYCFDKLKKNTGWESMKLIDDLYNWFMDSNNTFVTQDQRDSWIESCRLTSPKLGPDTKKNDIEVKLEVIDLETKIENLVMKTLNKNK